MAAVDQHHVKIAIGAQLASSVAADGDECHAAGISMGRPLEQGHSPHTPRKFEGELNTSVVAGVSDVQMALMDQSAQVVDARPATEGWLHDFQI